VEAAVTIAAHNAMTAYFPAAAPTFDAARDTASQPFRMVRPGQPVWRWAWLLDRHDVELGDYAGCDRIEKVAKFGQH
jgi:hypothetical protein